MPDPVFETVTLVVDGYAISGWQRVEVSRSMQHGAIDFELEATTTSLSDQALSLRDGQDVEIYTTPGGESYAAAGGDLLCAGSIDDYQASYAADSKTVTLSGRSKGRDPIDCPVVNHPTGRVENKTLLGVAQEFDEFGVTWSTDQQLPTLPMVQRHPVEPLFATIEREARKGGYMLAAQPDGGIKITRAGTTRHADALVLGDPGITSCRVCISPAAKRQPVVVRGQRRSGTGRTNLRQEYRDSGDGNDRHRPHIVLAEGDHSDDDLKRRARWQRLRLAGHGITVAWVVSAWRDADGLLWDPGRLMANRIDAEKLNCDLTLSTVRFIQDDKGTRADLTFVDPRTHGGSTPQGSADDAFDPGGSIDE